MQFMAGLEFLESRKDALGFFGWEIAGAQFGYDLTEAGHTSAVLQNLPLGHLKLWLAVRHGWTVAP